VQQTKNLLSCGGSSMIGNANFNKYYLIGLRSSTSKNYFLSRCWSYRV